MACRAGQFYGYPHIGFLKYYSKKHIYLSSVFGDLANHPGKTGPDRFIGWSFWKFDRKAMNVKWTSFEDE
jgi:hypothetical protein